VCRWQQCRLLCISIPKAGPPLVEEVPPEQRAQV
jgi:hypothetical protein